MTDRIEVTGFGSVDEVPDVLAAAVAAAGRATGTSGPQASRCNRTMTTTGGRPATPRGCR
jgi:hypothetical protein